MDAGETFYAFEKAWNSGDLEKAFSYCAKDYAFESSSGASTKGREKIKALMEGWLQAFPDLRFETKNVFASGSKAAAEYVMRGTQKKEFRGLPATGKSFAVKCCSILEFEGGVFTRENAYFDMTTLMRQLGHIPSAA